MSNYVNGKCNPVNGYSVQVSLTSTYSQDSTPQTVALERKSFGLRSS